MNTGSSPSTVVVSRSPRPRRPRRAGLAVLAVLLFTMAAPARADDAASSFGATNLAGNRWTYGWTLTRGSAFTLYNTYSTTPQGLQNWSTTGNRGGVFYNPTAAAPLGIPSRTLALYAGSPTAYAVVRYTALVSGTYAVRATFTVRTTGFMTTDVAVLQGSQVVYAAWLSPPVTSGSASMASMLTLSAGQTVDFVVGPADESPEYVGLDATVSLLPPNNPSAPAFVFGDQRFIACKWPGRAFESLAFDPVSRRLASGGDLADLCGNRVSDGPGDGPGLAWDPRTQTFWRVNPDRVVDRWSAAGVLLDTVFTVPLTFSVPGTGLDTLESVRGIAVDSNHVYLVDAGPAPGEITSNAWFKFTRTGTPVKSSKSTNLLAFLDADPDALVDDIVYVPHSSPFMPGRLLIALEHSGIQVINTEGNFVDRFRWSGQGLTPTSASKLDGKITAFAALAIDPATGNLYLGNNDTGDAQVWTRIPGTGLESYVVGVIGDGVSGVLHHPNPGCNLPLWNAIDPTSGGNFFGAAYRPADHAIYTASFGDGELWRFDARTGLGTRIGPTGVGSAWGVAYDTERHVVYLGAEMAASRRICTVDPVSGAAAPLPQATPFLTTDLAFNSVDHHLYALQSGTPYKLIRIDRDTGAGTIVGNTVTSRGGLDYDPVSGKLVTYDGVRLFRIAPATGAAETLAVVPNYTAWEGLAVVTLPAITTVAVGERPRGEERLELVAWPNPARAGATVSFNLPSAVEGSVRVFDVTGRVVRVLRKGRLEAGRHSLAWDGGDDGGRPLPSGVYFVRLDSGRHTQVARLTRVR